MPLILRDRVLLQMYDDQLADVPSTQAHLMERTGKTAGRISLVLNILTGKDLVRRGGLVGSAGTRGARRYHLTEQGVRYVRQLHQEGHCQ